VIDDNMGNKRDRFSLKGTENGTKHQAYLTLAAVKISDSRMRSPTTAQNVHITA
jgi:hypothetical protein